MLKYGSIAGVVEQADTRDLKSLGVKSVPVRSRSPAPKKNTPYGVFFFVICTGSNEINAARMSAARESLTERHID